MNRNALFVPLLLVVALGACRKQEAAPEPAPVPKVAPAPVAAASDTTPKPFDPATTFDIKGFSGTFKGTLPCADCPGIDESLTLNADGTFALKDSFQERKGDFDLSGSWTPEADGQRVRLDPGSKSENDRLFAITSNDELAPLDADGKPVPGTVHSSLKRRQQ